jgi:hypothetical protein
MPAKLTAVLDLDQAQTPTDVARSLPSSGPAWDAAIEFGIDVTLLERNLQLTPRERMQQAAQHLRFIEAVQQRTLPGELRARLEQERLWEKIDALGGPDPAWPEALRNGR